MEITINPQTASRLTSILDEIQEQQRMAGAFQATASRLRSILRKTRATLTDDEVEDMEVAISLAEGSGPLLATQRIESLEGRAVEMIRRIGLDQCSALATDLARADLQSMVDRITED
jgi:uncharacterized protein YgfB (UPF0149 family)